MKLPEKYRIMEKLGEGGMGEVYRAEDSILRRMVAIKIISRRGSSDLNAQGRFLREARAASAFNHPHIVTIYEMGESEEGAFIVMELVEGKNLREFIRRGRIDIATVVSYAIQICSALEEAHQGGVVHRDIKPENILITSRNQVKLVDFGLAKWLHPAEAEENEPTGHRLSHSGAIIGTPAYMSPEQIRGEDLDSRSDLFAVGVILHELLTGRLPFTGASPVEMAAAVLRDPITSLKDFQSGSAGKISTIVERCLEKQPGKRFASAGQLRAQLEIVFQELKAMQDKDTGELHALLPPIAPAPLTPTILILPLEAVGGDPDSNIFAIGLTHALLTDLARIEGISVLSKTAGGLRGAKDSGTSVAESAKELGATIVLEGEVMRSGTSMGVMARLSDVATGRVLWGTRYRGEIADMFEIQDEVCRNVATALQLNLTSDVRERISRPSTRNVPAFDAYARGRSLLERRDIKENIPASIQKFEEAIHLDPDFALAYAGLGEACWRRYKDTHDAAWVQRAVSACDHALILDPRQALVYVSLGLIYYGTGRTEEAIAELERAISMQSACDEAYKWLGKCWQRKGNLERAVHHFQRAIKIRPYWDHYEQLGACYFAFGKYEKAAEQFRKVIVLQPASFHGYSNLGAAYSLLGKFEDAVEMFLQAIRVYPNLDSYSNLGSAYFYLERYDEAAEAYRSALKLDFKNDICHRNLGDCHWHSGEKGEAEKEYRIACELLSAEIAINPENADSFARLAVCQAKLQMKDDAGKNIKVALQLDSKDTRMLYSQAVVHALTGNLAGAFQSLNDALNSGHSASEAATDPDLEPLRQSGIYGPLVHDLTQSR